MVFDSILGQDAAVQTLTRALASGHAHHAYRFEGPDGVGKERAAFAFAQSLLCERSGPLGCGECKGCRRAGTLSEEDPRVPLHPDVVLVARGLYSGAQLGTTHTEAASIGVEQIRRVVLSRVAVGPHESRAVCVIVRDAHELSISAANALLKTLEEPPNAFYFVLLTHRPADLPDTVRSRTLNIRFAPLPAEALRQILERHGLSPDAAAWAGGSAALALRLSDPEAAAAREAFQTALDRALSAPNLATAIAAAERRPEGRDELRAQLSLYAHTLAERARQSLEARPAESGRLAEHYRLVLQAARDVDRNAQPQLLLEGLIARMRHVQSP
jgi:DNA polymerase-3 subunit delta'